MLGYSRKKVEHDIRAAYKVKTTGHFSDYLLKRFYQVHFYCHVRVSFFMTGTELLFPVPIQFLLLLTPEHVLAQNLTLGYESLIYVLHPPHATQKKTVKCKVTRLRSDWTNNKRKGCSLEELTWWLV